jgi:hypothetical protein
MAHLTEEQKQAVIEIYVVTQRHLRAKKVSHIVLYRGFSWRERSEWVIEGLSFESTAL